MKNGGFKVLIAEDDLDIGDLLAMMLEDRDCIAETAENGRIAVDLLAESHFDLLICDLRMPEMDGIAVLEWCQQRQPELPVAVLTAQREVEVEVSARPNVKLWLQKPFSMQQQEQLEELISTLRSGDDT